MTHDAQLRNCLSLLVTHFAEVVLVVVDSTLDKIAAIFQQRFSADEVA